jgi:prepilin peptidase CpaA
MSSGLTSSQIALLAAFLATLASHDLATSRIPNALTLPFALVAVLTHTLNAGLSGMELSVGGALLVLPLLAPMYITGGLGAGDVKALCAVGAMLGPLAGFWATLFTVLVGGLCGLFVLLTHWSSVRIHSLFRHGSIRHTSPLGRPDALSKPSLESPPLSFPYGLAIAFGTAASILWA